MHRLCRFGGATHRSRLLRTASLKRSQPALANSKVDSVQGYSLGPEDSGDFVHVHVYVQYVSHLGFWFVLHDSTGRGLLAPVKLSTSCRLF